MALTFFCKTGNKDCHRFCSYRCAQGGASGRRLFVPQVSIASPRCVLAGRGWLATGASNGDKRSGTAEAGGCDVDRTPAVKESKKSVVAALAEAAAPGTIDKSC
jgi:hypothetical protein